ncbi:hypothetical protein RRG08_021101 [Elysia crispata]|uniref:Uncharacterized protein n=1 Tax=Elysia crispata TaxID=231223 RepID=A0AAE0Z5U2_9GAST|nr:hypothetical protein RRG08_021101 [Elysia crispata]
MIMKLEQRDLVMASIRVSTRASVDRQGGIHTYPRVLLGLRKETARKLPQLIVKVSWFHQETVEEVMTMENVSFLTRRKPQGFRSHPLNSRLLPGLLASAIWWRRPVSTRRQNNALDGGLFTGKLERGAGFSRLQVKTQGTLGRAEGLLYVSALGV